MRQAALIAVFAALVVCSGPPAAVAQDACVVLRVRPGSVLEHCGDHLQALTIRMDDIRRQPGVDPSGTFSFTCPIGPLCADEPQITGWMVERHRWTDSGRDEAAIFDIFRRPPGAAAGWIGEMPEQPDSECGIFDASVAGLPGRAVCYRVESTKANAIVVAAANDEVGCLLVFHRQEGDMQTLREKVLTILPRFRMDVDKGDVGLMKWLR